MIIESPSIEAEIRDVVDVWESGVRARDSARTLGTYAADAVNFDVAPPLRTKGGEVLDRRKLEAWFAGWTGPIGIEHRELEIAVSGDLALVHGLMHYTGTQGGEEADIWLRHTLGLRRDEEGWRIVHEHTSVPFYMDGSYRAAVDLRP